MVWTILHVLIIFGVPYLSNRLAAVTKSSILSPVVLCYATGIALRNLTPFPVDESLAENLYQGSIILAIPLLLFSADLVQTLRYAGKSLLSFIVCVLCGIFCVGVATFIYMTKIPLIWIKSGMIVGIFTGGTPNAQAIAIALEAPSETIILVNGADTVIGAFFLIFLTSFAPMLYARILPKFQKDPKADQLNTDSTDQLVPVETLKSVGLAVLIVGISAGLTYLLYGGFNNQSNTFLILALTTFSILASFSTNIRRWRGSFLTGEYLLLVFCVAVGMSANLIEILNTGLDILGFYTVSFFGTVLLHIFFSRLLKIDRDTVLITSTAAFYGPVFIGQIATTLNNRSLIFTGIALSIFGLAIGNYVGIGVSYLLEYLIS
jgi:uncharacterized membrane protein